ncbi:hypothetical protein OG871_03420 [Kitasatospora sp. NBC_00374]|uniref:hypothetical protein n=1 Tax=Kitasatospora sp. NBC_00374 TaxID=2975964 RepID=UPI0032557BD1
MLILGVLLLAATGAFTGLLIAGNLDGGADYTVTVFGGELVTMSSLAIFLAGIALTLLFGLGCLLALAGARRTRRRTAELRAARATAAARGPAYARAVDPAADPAVQPDVDPAVGPDADRGGEPAPEPARRRHGFVHRLGH